MHKIPARILAASFLLGIDSIVGDNAYWLWKEDPTHFLALGVLLILFPVLFVLHLAVIGIAHDVGARYGP